MVDHTSRVRVLGTAQDGGVPHLGCHCERCTHARADPTQVRYPASLLVERSEPSGGGGWPDATREPIDPAQERADAARERHDDADDALHCLLVDASMDLRHQVADVDAVLLTHAHVGHLPGLLQFGREVAASDALPVYCTEGLATLVRSNAPFSSLCDQGNVDLRVLGDGDVVPFGRNVEIRVQQVPHRDEHETRTLAVSVEGSQTVRYIPDVDGWTEDLVAWVAAADVAVVDGTFWSDDELPRQTTVPHPCIRDALDRLPADKSVWFTHLNHTNPVLGADTPERRRVEKAGFGVVERGQTFET